MAITQVAAEDPLPADPPSQEPTLTFALVLGSIALINPLSIHLFLPMIPAVKAEFGLTEAMAQWTFTIAVFAMSIATLAYGSLSDRYGRRPVLMAGLALFFVGAAVSALAPSVGWLFAGRLVQSIGAGCGISLVRAIARDAYGPQRLVKAIAYLTMVYTLGPMISPMVGGGLVDVLGWRAVFGFAFAAGAVIATAAYFIVYETHHNKIVDGGVVAMLGHYAQLFSHPRFTAYVLQTGFCSGTFFALATAGSFLMIEYLHRPAVEFGLWFSVFPFGYLLGTFISSRLGTRAAPETVILAGSLVSVVVAAVIAAFMLAGRVSPFTLFVPGFFLPMAQGMTVPYTQSGAMAVVPRLAGTASGVGVFTQFFCGAVFAQLYGFLADGTPRPLAYTLILTGSLTLIAGAVPFVMARRANALT